MGLTTSEWALRLKSSPTLAIKALADDLAGDGQPIFNFGIGEMNPEIPVPDGLKAAIAEALSADATHYSPAAGAGALVEALASDLEHFGLNYTDSQIVVCPGPKDALFKTCLALLCPAQKRNRLLTFTPTYESFENVPVLVTGKDALLLETDANLHPEPDKLAKALEGDPSIKVVIINSPNNPSGSVYPRDLIEELARVLGQHPEVAVISDEVYRTIRYDDSEPYCSIASLLPEQTFVVGGMSKELSGTGLRVGFVAGPKEGIRVVENVQGNASSCVNLPTQLGYAQFLREDANLSQRLAIRDELRSRRDVLIALFRKFAPEATWTSPQGAFYFFPGVQRYLGRKTPSGKVLETDHDLACYLVEQARVVTVPGSAFLRPGHLRFAYACAPLASFEEGFARIGKALEALSVSQ